MRALISAIRPLAFASGILLALTGCPGPAPQGVSTPEPTPKATPAPTPPPPPYVPSRKTETGKIFNGMQYRVTLETEFGTTATAERNNPESYAAELVMKVKVPKPHQNLEEIARLNGQLPSILPGLATMIESAAVSPRFDDLYRLKVTALRNALNRLDGLLSRHNFYDCETILELQHPETKRSALFIQSDMDVDTDGSDTDRVPEIVGASSTFQPFTSYRWPKKTQNPSSFVPGREAKLKQNEQELASNPPAARREQLRAAQAQLKDEIAELKSFSYLVGQADPFIVLPLSMFGKSKAGPFAPSIGDYCVVIHGGVIYPAIVGDAGPPAKMGEASLRICKQILPNSNSANRAVSDLKVTYIVFPGTVERPFSVPDLEKWRIKCAKLIDEIGGHRGELFVWEDVTKPKATPAPTIPAATPVAPATTPVPASTPASVATNPAPSTTPAPPAPSPTRSSTPAPPAEPTLPDR